MNMIQEQESPTVSDFFLEKPQEKSGDMSFFLPLIEKFF